VTLTVTRASFVCYHVVMSDCIFCKIVSGEAPSFKIYEDDSFLAFLSIFPKTVGSTVVIPKKHYSSYVFNLPDNIYRQLLDVTRKVARQLDSRIEDSDRTALVFEGLEVDHVHAKLYPLHGGAELYEGESPIEGPRASDDDLKKIAEDLSET